MPKSSGGSMTAVAPSAASLLTWTGDFSATAVAAGAEGKLPVAAEESMKAEGTPTPATELGTSS